MNCDDGNIKGPQPRLPQPEQIDAEPPTATCAIGLTARGRKPDILWFNLLHEIDHVLLHPRRTTFLDLDTEKTVSDPAEQQADTSAEQALLRDDARAMVARATTREQLLLLAPRPGVGVTIIAGHHGHATGHWRVGDPCAERSPMLTSTSWK